MACMIIRNNKDQIKSYCFDNNLSYDKLMSSYCSWNDKEVFVLDSTPNPAREKLGLMDDELSPIALEIYLEDGKLRFEQTEYTQKYLGAEPVVDNPRETVSNVLSRKSKIITVEEVLV